MHKSFSWAVLLAFAALAPVARADVWDLPTIAGDNSINTTENELVHRSVQIHDLAAIGGAADHDYFRIAVRPYSAYEIVVDGTTSDISTIVLERLNSAGTLIASSTGVSSLGYTRVLRWENTTNAVSNQFIHVKSGSCTTTCTASAAYRIRAYDTSYSIERFYDNGTTFTNLVLANPNDYSIDVHVMYFAGGVADSLITPPGAELHTIAARNEVVLGPPSGFTAIAGHVIVTSNGGYGDVRGKAAQFDTDPSFPQSWDNDLLIRR